MTDKPPDWVDIAEFVRLTHALHNQELADRYRRRPSTVKHWKTWLRQQGYDVGRGGFPDSPTPDFAAAPRLRSDKFIIAGDFEIPDFRVELLELIIAVAQRLDVSDLILCGDVLAVDGMSNWLKLMVRKMAFSEELDYAEQILRTLLSHFRRAWWIMGNHERRVAWRTEGEVSVEDFFRGFAGLTITPYSHCIVASGKYPDGTDREIYVTHPKNYRQRPLALPLVIATTKLMCVAAGHTHHQAVGYHPSGKFWICDTGCCRDPRKTAYKELNTTTHPEWNPGFVLVWDGMPYLINEENAEFWENVSL